MAEPQRRQRRHAGIFPPLSATGHLGGIDLVKFDGTCKMIEFEVMFSPLKVLAAQTEEAGNRIGPAVGPVEAGSGCHSRFFWAFLHPSDPAACLRQRGPCGKNRPPVGAFWADSGFPGHAAVAQW